MKTDSLDIRDLRQQEWLWTSKVLLFHADVDGNNYKVYCGLSAYADNKTQEAYPSIATLARKLHMGTRTVIRGLQKLEAAGFIRVDRTIGEHNVYYLLNVGGDLPRRPKVKPTEAAAENWVKEILQWAEAKKGAKFVNYGKQIGALGLMQKSGYGVDEIRGCYEMLEKDTFWRSKGFDFTTVANELPKKIGQIRQSHGKLFEHLTQR